MVRVEKGVGEETLVAVRKVREEFHCGNIDR